MIILSKLADYGVILAVRLAQAGDVAAAGGASSGAQMTAHALSDETRLPKTTVAKVLKSLARAGIVASARGATGGYHLARPASLITVADVVAALDGPLGVTQCSIASEPCERSAYCGTKPHWARINRAVSAALAAVTVADMTVPPPAASLLHRGVADTVVHTQERPL